MKQWNGNEYWAVCRQFVFVIISLLIKDDLAILKYVQTITYFVYMAHYKFLTNKMLYYMKYALY